MIETEQTALVRAGIADVWDYVQDIARWASIMPGYRECEIIDPDNSRWILKVGVGGLVRTVKVRVQVDEWAGPETVRFTYKLEGDPVQGGGTYTATSKGPHETEIALKVRVEGSGPMAPMWEAMGKPLLPQFARSFAEQLKDEIEKVACAGSPALAAPSPQQAKPSSLLDFIVSLWRRLFGRREHE